MQNIQLLSTALDLKIDKDTVYVYTQFNGISLFTYEFLKKRTAICENLNHKVCAYSFNNDYSYFLFSDGFKIYLLDIEKSVVIKTFKSNEEVVSLIFDKTQKYFFCTTKKGRVYQYRIDSLMQISRLITFKKSKDYIFNLDIDLQNLYIASNKELALIDLHTNVKKYRLEFDFNIEFLKIIDDYIIFLGDDFTFYLFKRAKISKSVTTKFNAITGFELIDNSYALISYENKIALFDLINFKVINYNYLEFKSDIVKIALYKNSLVVALKNFEVELLNISKEQELQELIYKERLDDAFALVANNPMLKSSKYYTELEKLYNHYIDEVIYAYTHNNHTLADKIIKKYLTIDSKKHHIQDLQYSFKNYYARFKNLVLEKKYAIAYAMSDKYPFFKQTPYYEKMEEAWQQTFADAQRQMLLKQYDLAKSILSEYITTTSKRSLVKFVLSYNKEFLEFLKAVKNRDFKTIQKIIKLNNIFKEVPSYIALEKEVYERLDSLKIRLINLENIDKDLKELENIFFIQSELNSIKSEYKEIKRLKTAYDNNNFKLCYELLDNYPFLSKTELAKLLQKHWQKVLSKAEDYALRGELKGVIESFGELLLVKTRVKKIGDIIRLSYLSKIKMLIAKKSYKKAEVVIYAYIDKFGDDKEITNIKQIFEKRSKIKLALYEPKKVDRDSWIDEFL